MSSDAGVRSCDIALAALRAAVDRLGLAPGPASPLGAVEGAGHPPDGFRPEEWKDAMVAIARPDRRIRCAVAAPSRLFEAAWYGAGRGPFCGWTLEGARARLVWPVTVADIAGLAGHALLGNPFTPRDTFEASFSPPALAAFAAAVDAVRAGLFASLLHRRPGGTFELERPHLEAQLTDGLASGDARWIVTLLDRLLPPELAPRPSTLDSGIAELLSAGLLRPAGAAWTPGPDLLAVAAGWRLPLPAIAHEAIEWSGNGVARRGHRVSIRGDGPLRTLDAEFGTAGAGARLRSVDGGDWLAELAGMLEAPPEEPRPLAHPADETRGCPKCGTRLPVHAKFCLNCAAPQEGPPAGT